MWYQQGKHRRQKNAKHQQNQVNASHGESTESVTWANQHMFKSNQYQEIHTIKFITNQSWKLPLDGSANHAIAHIYSVAMKQTHTHTSIDLHSTFLTFALSATKYLLAVPFKSYGNIIFDCALAVYGTIFIRLLRYHKVYEPKTKKKEIIFNKLLQICLNQVMWVKIQVAFKIFYSTMLFFFVFKITTQVSRAQVQFRHLCNQERKKSPFCCCFS